MFQGSLPSLLSFAISILKMEAKQWACCFLKVVRQILCQKTKGREEVGDKQSLREKKTRIRGGDDCDLDGWSMAWKKGRGQPQKREATWRQREEDSWIFRGGQRNLERGWQTWEMVSSFSVKYEASEFCKYI